MASLGGWVRDCHFHDNGSPSIGYCNALNFYQPSYGVLVEQCRFDNNFGVGVGSYWSGCQDIDIVGCSFDDGVVGIAFVDGASGSARNNTIEQMQLYGFYMPNVGSVVIEDNNVSCGAGVGVSSWYSADGITMHNNIIASDYMVVNIDAQIDASDISNNHFFRTSDTAWWVYTADYYPLSEPRIIHLENNYWGTTDTALLDQYIFDGNDDPDVDIFVDYLPLADGPVPTSPATWGAVKSLFYGGEGK
jgi:hypothetical protein